MITMKPVRVLFFVDGTSPTSEDIVKAGSYNAQVMFRNARAVPAEGSLEDCDGVTGVVPPRYAERFPTAEAAIEKRTAELAALASKVGDSPAPVSPPPVPPKEPEKGASSDAADAQQPADKAEGATGAGDALAQASQAAPGASPDASAGSVWKSR